MLLSLMPVEETGETRVRTFMTDKTATIIENIVLFDVSAYALFKFRFFPMHTN